jgi:filamentous hemagglutinin family protein
MSARAGGTLPTGGQYVAGQGSISGSGNGLTVTQSSSRGIVNWQSFSIGSGNSVFFENGQGATLNRVTGGNLSLIDGSLSATGSVYLINPQGIVIGPGGTIITNGSFVASTRDVSNNAFMSGNAFSASGTSNGNVINQGVITSNNGDAILVGQSVTNSGTISAPNGTVGLAAGNEILLRPAGSDPRISISGGTGSVTNTGSIRAAQAELNSAGGNVYALVENNSGIVSATGTQTIGGHVWLTAGGTATVTGTLTAQNANGSGGTVTVRGNDIAMSGTVDASARAADATGGAVSIVAANTGTVAGRIDAAGGANARGGSIETSGHFLSIDGSAVNAGKGGNWLLDPYDLTVDNAAASTINGALGGGTSVMLQTMASGTSGPGNANASGNGDISIESAINWGTSATLTLDAYHSIDILAPITVSGAGGVVLKTNDGGTNGGLSFGLGSGGFAGNIAFTGSPHSGQSLIINGDTYTLLYSMSDLQNIDSSSAALSGDYALADSLDATSVGSWKPIGTTGTSGILNSSNGFSGIFDGLGNTISNLTVNIGSHNAAGLFGYSSGTIRDIALNGGSVSGGTEVGGLVGRNEGTIVDASAAVAVSGIGSVGGFVGWNDGIITNGKVWMVSVTATGYGAGGFVGYNRTTGDIQDSTVSGNNAAGTITTSGVVYGSGGVGGFVGLNTGDIASGSVAQTDAGMGGVPVTAVGGFAGQNTATGTITDGTVTDTAAIGNNFVGGFIGINLGAINGSTVSTAASGSVLVSGVNEVGGFAGSNGAGAMITNSTSEGATKTSAITGTGSRIGGFVGWNAGSLTGDQSLDAVTGVAQVGGFVGWNDGTVTDGQVWTVYVTATGYGAGGFVGYNTSTGNIQSSNVSGNNVADTIVTLGTVDGSSSGGVGGFVGYNSGSLSSDGVTQVKDGHASIPTVGGFAGVNTASGSITDGAVTDSVAIGGNFVGGFVGSNSGSIDGSTDVTTTAPGAHSISGTNNVGGFAGGNTQGATIENSASSETIADSVPVVGSGNIAGGFAGLNSGSLIGDQSSDSVGGTANVGGLVGYNGSSISGSSATGAVTSSGPHDGGLVGENAASGTITNSYSSGSAAGPTIDICNGQDDIGGLVGDNLGSIGLSYATGTVSGIGSVGGLVGSNSGAVGQSYATGTVTGGNGSSNDNSDIGGLVGRNFGSINSSYATGAVSGEYDVGGLVGQSFGGAINNTYATGSVLGYEDVGGLEGDLTAGSINNSYSTGAVSSSYTGGSNFFNEGAIGVNDDGTIANVYWDTQTSGKSEGLGFDGTNQYLNVIGLTTTQLQGTLPNGFSSSIWGTGPSLFPYFRWQYPTTPQAISGTAFGDGASTTSSGGSPLAAGSVSLEVNGANLGSVWSGANGYFYFVEPSGTISGGGSAVAAYIPSGSGGIGGVRVDTLTGSTSNFDVWGNTLIAPTTATTYSVASATTLQSQDTSLIASAEGSNTALQTLVDGLSNYGYIAKGSNFTIDAPLSPANGLYVETVANNAGITLNDPITLGGPNGLALDATGALTIDAQINVTGAGRVELNAGYDTATVPGTSLLELSFGLGGTGFAGNISYGATDNGGSLTIDGTPYTLVYSMSQMQAINNSSARLSANYALADSLDATAVTNWIPLGTNGSLGGETVLNSGSGFTGAFEGLGNTVSNLTVSGKNYAGLIGFSRGTIRDIGIIGGTETSDNATAGGLVGANNGTVANAFSTANISGPSAVGGLVGSNGPTGTINNSYATGTISSESTFAGGLAGANEGIINDSYATGPVSGDFGIGGLVGISFGPTADIVASLSNVYATGPVSGRAEIGGLVGDNQGAISSAYATGLVTVHNPSNNPSYSIGGLIGQNDSGIISNSYWDTETTGMTIGIGTDSNAQSGNIADLTTAQLQSGLPSGFDPAIWGSDPSINDGLPYLLGLSGPH